MRHLVLVPPPPPSSTGADTAKVFGAAAADADVPLPTTSDDSDIRRMLDHVLTIQAGHRQILVDVLNEIRGLRAELAQFRRFSLLPLLMIDFDCSLAFHHKKGEYIFEFL